MKYIDLKEFTEEVHSPGGMAEIRWSTVELVENALNTPPKEGFTLKDYRKRERISVALEDCKASGMLVLEDADFTVLKECVNDMRFKIRSKFVLEFLEELELNKEVPKENGNKVVNM